MERVKFIGGGILWTFICWILWINVIFWGYPKTHEDLIEMGYTELNFAIQNIMGIAIPIIWLAAPILYFIYLNRKQKER